MTSTASPAWFRRHFNEDYLILYSGRSEEEAEEEAGFIARELDIGPADRVLDLCCGFGRHLKAFARGGIDAVGVDLSPALLDVARREVGGRLVCADMLRLPFRDGADVRGAEDDHASPAGFSVVANFFTSFGYFDRDDENRAAAREMARVLRPDGRFSIDLLNPEPTIRNLVPSTERREGPFRIIEERRWDAGTRRLEKKIRLENRKTGVSRAYFESVRVYGEREARALLEDAGLEVLAVFGDFQGRPHGPDTPRMILTGRRKP